MRTASLLCALVALFASCSGSSGGGLTTPPPTAAPTFSGEWMGTFRSSRGPSGVVGCLLRQSGSGLQVRQLEVLGGQCQVASTASGSTQGRSMTITARMQGGGDLTMQAKLAGNDLSGSYQISGGRCGGDTGSVQMTRTQ